ncbi:SEC-C metal-binding domain-containing protein [Marinagarivorans cellulosilyticus]|uniref:SEC-C metal-binding domain-containing protein n=1 Tax=Marinagarivorans cellulosilyticus TaxID=2721545 RepID=UPI001F295FEA|nr:SEC-C metal-binding domain-containing protein [Marinagarivorans cellulosilyticus]
MNNLECNEASNPLEADEPNNCCPQASCCAPPTPFVNATPRIGRNDPCPCDSGKKYKKRCG